MHSVARVLGLTSIALHRQYGVPLAPIPQNSEEKFFPPLSGAADQVGAGTGNRLVRESWKLHNRAALHRRFVRTQSHAGPVC